MDNCGNTPGSGSGKGRGKINPDEAPLRRPHQDNPSNDLAKNSTLSAEAAEFVPKCYTQPQQSSYAPRHSVQDRLQVARENQNVHHAMIQRQTQQHGQWGQQIPIHQYHQIAHQPQYIEAQASYGVTYQAYNQPHIARDYGQYDGGSGDYIDKNLADEHANEIMSTIMQLESAMRTLTMNPGKFDSLVGHLVDSISPFLDQPESCQQIFGMILHQCISEGNFRYSGARLCTHLDSVAAAADKASSAFRDTLLNQCKQKTEEQAQTWRQITKHTDEDEKKCHGFIFLLAELVTQMEPLPASELGKLFIKLISTVLQNPAPNSAKNICQALKLAGQTLERENSGNRMEMEQVMRSLSNLVIQGPADISVQRMVKSVSELRSGNWGRSNHVPAPVEIPATTTHHVVNEPIFYGPDGQIISEEEARFLEDLAAEEYNNYREQTPWENDEDDMIAEAYEEFLRSKPNSTQKENEKNSPTVQTNNSSEH